MAGRPKVAASKAAPNVPEYNILVPKLNPRLIPEITKSNVAFMPSTANRTQSAGEESTVYTFISGSSKDASFTSNAFRISMQWLFALCSYFGTTTVTSPNCFAHFANGSNTSDEMLSSFVINILMLLYNSFTYRRIVLLFVSSVLFVLFVLFILFVLFLLFVLFAPFPLLLTFYCTNIALHGAPSAPERFSGAAFKK